MTEEGRLPHHVWMLWMLPLALAAYLCHDGRHHFKLYVKANFPHVRLLFVRYLTQKHVTQTVIYS